MSDVEQTFHLSYTMSDDCRLLFCIFTDDIGELFERAVIPMIGGLGQALTHLWTSALRSTSSTSIPWRVVVCKLGKMPDVEAKSLYLPPAT